jgi:hypothetical protein
MQSAAIRSARRREPNGTCGSPKKVLNRFPRMRSLNRTPDSIALRLFAEPQYQ